jgi:hypothetical protein
MMYEIHLAYWQHAQVILPFWGICIPVSFLYCYAMQKFHVYTEHSKAWQNIF